MSDGEAQMHLNFGDKVRTSPLAADSKINDGEMHTITLAIRNKAAILGVDGKTIHQFSIEDNIYPVKNLYIGKGKVRVSGTPTRLQRFPIMKLGESTVASTLCHAIWS